MKKLMIGLIVLGTLVTLTSCNQETTSIINHSTENNIVKKSQTDSFYNMVPNVKLGIVKNLKQLKIDYNNEFIKDIKNNKFKGMNKLSNFESRTKKNEIKKFCNLIQNVNGELNTQNSPYMTLLFSKKAKKEMTLIEYNTFDNFNKGIYSCAFDVEIIADKTKRKRTIETIDIPVSENLDFTEFDKIIDTEFKKLSDIIQK